LEEEESMGLVNSTRNPTRSGKWLASYKIMALYHSMRVVLTTHIITYSKSVILWLTLIQFWH